MDQGSLVGWSEIESAKFSIVLWRVALATGVAGGTSRDTMRQVVQHLLGFCTRICKIAFKLTKTAAQSVFIV